MFVYTVSCIQTFNRLSNRFGIRLYRVNGAKQTNKQTQNTKVSVCGPSWRAHSEPHHISHSDSRGRPYHFWTFL